MAASTRGCFGLEHGCWRSWPGLVSSALGLQNEHDMTGSQSDIDPVAGATTEPEREAPTGMPRWVKISLIIALVLVLLFVVAKITGAGGDHGPGRHGRGDATPSTVAEGGGHTPPVDHSP